ncbi:reprolysin-like metallopeptidase [Catenovulum sediminis]|uniref:Reprolysin-like metallopeptidase n=1 Tax=Catenovulum sediminis TaxID=1740262 RepID=A0ABV1RDP0_9ALTE
MKKLITPILLCCLPILGHAWEEVAVESVSNSENTQVITGYKMNSLSTQQIEKLKSLKANESAILDLPNELNQRIQFIVKFDPILPSALQQAYPDIRTYQGYQIDKPENTGRFDTGPNGFHAMFTHNNQTFYLDPAAQGVYKFYRYQHGELKDSVLHKDAPATPTAARGALAENPGLTTFRLAVSTTAEYTSFFGSKTAALNAITTTINRVNQIYLRDLAIKLQLVNNMDALIFTSSSTDPYKNNDPSADIKAAQTTIDETIGSDNYDIGHVFGTDGGGLAQVGAVCRTGFKAQGLTGTRRPTGEAFNVDFVAHEIGHQFGANHTFNGTAGFCGGEDARQSQSAYELGGGVTIMGYAGICSDNGQNENIQNSSIAAFHVKTIEEIHQYIRFGAGRFCGTYTNDGNQPPEIQTNLTTMTIPAETPFILSATANDSDSLNLLYSWEQYDLGDETTDRSDWANAINGPTFRNYLPTAGSTRYVPNLDDLVFERSTNAEILPKSSRDLNFKLVVRDGDGAVVTEQLTLNVDGTTGPFKVLSPSAEQNFNGRQTINVTWDVAGTDSLCSHVDILMTDDFGASFNHTLANSVNNSGSATVELPNISALQSKIMVMCSEQTFFNLSEGFFSIQADESPLITGQKATGIEQGESFEITPASLIIDDINDTSFTLSADTGSNYSLVNNTVTPNADFSGQLQVPVQVSDGANQSNEFNFTITVAEVSEPEPEPTPSPTPSPTPTPTPSPEPEDDTPNVTIKAGSSGSSNGILVLILGIAALIRRSRLKLK